MTASGGATDRTHAQDLTVAEALKLLGDVRFGRVVFTSRAMPAVRPVRHIMADGQIIIAAGLELVHRPLLPGVAGTDAETILAYEADQLDITGCSGWSVVVVGRARPVTGQAEAALYRAALPAATVPDQLVAISADVVTGQRLSCGDSLVASSRPSRPGSAVSPRP